MATINPVSSSNAGAMVNSQNTAAGGDEFTFRGKPLMLMFTNGHSSPITVSFAAATGKENVLSPAGSVPVPARSLAVSANGGVGVFRFSPADVEPYLNSAGRIAVTYTGHNAALVVRAIEA